MAIDQKARQEVEILMAETFPEVDFAAIDAERASIRRQLVAAMSCVDSMASVYASPTCRKFRDGTGRIVAGIDTMRDGTRVKIFLADYDGTSLSLVDEVVK